MLDRLFLQYLTKSGVKAYWIGQIIIDAIFIYYILGIAGYSFDDDSTHIILIFGAIAVSVICGAICLLLFKKKYEPAN